MKKKVLIGMSGGVDSSVAAYLLQKEGYEVIGATMQVWQDDTEKEIRENGCCSLKAVNDAEDVADKLGIPFYVINFKDIFRKNVIDYFIDEYLEGRTPNPCVACNKYIKFDAFLKKARAIGADYVATGHYALVEENNGRVFLKKSPDDTKDQSYALYNLTQDELKHTLFPCGKYRKTQIREIAEEIGLDVFNKRDSQEICFIEDNNHGKFIKNAVPDKVKEGNFVDKTGKVLGKHKGIVYYTIGQRKGLGLSLGKPVFVIDIIPWKNEVVIGDEEDLLRTTLIAKDINLISFDVLEEPMKIKAKIRYSAKPTEAIIYPLKDGKIKVVFKDKQRAITKGQSVVFYQGDYVIGGGIIDQIL